MDLQRQLADYRISSIEFFSTWENDLCNGLKSQPAGTAIKTFSGRHSLHPSTPPGQDFLPLKRPSLTDAFDGFLLGKRYLISLHDPE